MLCERKYHIFHLWQALLFLSFPECHNQFLPPAIRRMGEGNSFSLSTFRGGGVPDPAMDGGGWVLGPGLGGEVPSLRFSGGGTHSQILGGGTWSQILGGKGVPSLRFLGGTQSQIFGGEGGYLVSVKGKIFDTRFGLIHVQTGKKFFVEGPPPQ